MRDMHAAWQRRATEDALRAQLAAVTADRDKSYRNEDEVGAQLAEAVALLREARYSVEREVQELRASYGERLLHKQEPVRELLVKCDAYLARVGEGKP